MKIIIVKTNTRYMDLAYRTSDYEIKEFRGQYWIVNSSGDLEVYGESALWPIATFRQWLSVYYEEGTKGEN